jgi:DNA-binding NarL/FixJ family response regulator
MSKAPAGDHHARVHREGSVKIVVVDPNATVRQGTELLLREWGHHVVGFAEDVERGYALAVKRRPQVVVADAGACGRDGYALARRIAAEHPEIAVVLQLHEPSEPELSAALSCGTRFVTLKREDPEKLRSAVAEAGGTARSARPRALTSREREVLQLLADGASGNEAALALGISPETVRAHVKKSMRKLGAHTRVHAVTRAIASAEIRL